ncbi:putative short-chain oxidoreductase [Sistotremastrum niveocremeum HHB9708]|uniref:Putative short-chain oxidoreductase n=1 Tax=Sistotremastrum niveocremeum HHB9708 TaxID=1314777 RepID=A0A164PYD5_9AGAM|nr:putative short-chain oxidoreductase [Sistotremastrum niveocremeum HHB9708]
MSSVWLITGCSSGFGHDLALCALKRGDKVIATSRGNVEERLVDLKQAGADVLALDVTADPTELESIAKQAIGIYGAVDILVNNAGYVLQGAMEENNAEDIQKQFNANFFGVINVTRAFLPHFRERKSGAIAMIGSRGGFMGFPGVGSYIATKYALAGLTECLACELRPLNIKVTCIEPGDFRTSVWKGDNSKKPARHIPDYDETAGVMAKHLTEDFHQPGDPIKGAQRIFEALKGEGFARGKTLPVRLALGDDSYGNILDWSARRMTEAKEWKEWSTGTDF